MERTKEEATATTKLVRETVGRGKMGIYNCVGIWDGDIQPSTSQEIGAQSMSRNLKKYF